MTKQRCCSLLMKLLVAVALWMTFNESAAVGVHLEPSRSDGGGGVKCPSDCADLFLKLQDGVQAVRMDLRAEPKSGSSTTGEWAWGALVASCLYIQSLYGENSCQYWVDGHVGHVLAQPASASGEYAPCSCTNVKTVSFVVKFYDDKTKHFLPVAAQCSYRHRFGIVDDPDDPVCRPKTGRPSENMGDLWQCVEDEDCKFPNDEVLQVAVMRDPRAITVSSYFHRLNGNWQSYVDEHPELFTSVDTYFQRVLGAVCRWSSVRYLLFTEILGDRSKLFWFEDLFVDPVDFHGRLLSFAGLRLPLETVVDMARVASGGGGLYGFKEKGPDKHVGGIKPGANRTFRNELSSESLAMMDDVMRTWMPPVVLQRFGIAL